MCSKYGAFTHLLFDQVRNSAGHRRRPKRHGVRDLGSSSSVFSPMKRQVTDGEGE